MCTISVVEGVRYACCSEMLYICCINVYTVPVLMTCVLCAVVPLLYELCFVVTCSLCKLWRAHYTWCSDMRTIYAVTYTACSSDVEINPLEVTCAIPAGVMLERYLYRTCCTDARPIHGVLTGIVYCKDMRIARTIVAFYTAASHQSSPLYKYHTASNCHFDLQALQTILLNTFDNMKTTWKQNTPPKV